MSGININDITGGKLTQGVIHIVPCPNGLHIQPAGYRLVIEQLNGCSVDLMMLSRGGKDSEPDFLVRIPLPNNTDHGHG